MIILTPSVSRDLKTAPSCFHKPISLLMKAGNPSSALRLPVLTDEHEAGQEYYPRVKQSL